MGGFGVRHIVLIAFAAIAALLGGAAYLRSLAPEPAFTPEVGQPGKDVIWVPTPEALVAEMLRVAEVGPEDVVVDLGSGDGRIPIVAARDFSARARGVEYNPQMVALSREKAAAAGVGERATFIEADIFDHDFTDATVVTMYLLPDLNMKLRPQLLDLEPGVRIVSHAFDLGDWTPDAEVVADGERAYLWIVPADVAGEWRLRTARGGRGALRLAQIFQGVGGEGNLAGTALRVVEGRLRGRRLSLTLTDDTGQIWRLEGEVNGRGLGAVIEGPSGSQPLTGELQR